MYVAFGENNFLLAVQKQETVLVTPVACEAFSAQNQCLRPHLAQHTSSRPITEVKQPRAWLVLGWVTTWEYRVL